MSKRIPKTQFLLHKQKREYTVFQEPYRSGKSRQGLPVLALQSIPFNMSRFGFDGLPFPVFSGGIASFMRSQSESLISWRLIIGLLSPVFMEDYATICRFVQLLFFRHALAGQTHTRIS